ncbi:hypothetical protein [Mucilaginibacter sp.]|uniref:hypothetical protein n=1 Tax=Mucilaginibacter sp. TaxID=1882438 RepID=UPI0035BBEB0E
MNRIQHLPYQLITLLITLFTFTNLTSGVAQTTRGTVRGKVVTSKNDPASNVSIGLEGTNYGTTTNEIESLLSALRQDHTK